MSITAEQILKSSQGSLASHLGDLDKTCEAIHSPENAGEKSIVFVSDAQGLDLALAKKAPIILLPTSLKDKCPESKAACFFFYKDRSFAMSQVLPLFEEATEWPTGAHKTAIVPESVKVGTGTSIGAYVVIGERVVVGANCQIDPHTVIESDVTIGDQSVLGAHSFIARQTEIGKNCRIKAHASIGTEGYGFAPTATGNHRIPQLGKVVIEDEVSIGSFTAIDRATLTETRIKKGTKIDNLVHIAHNCVVGEHCLLTAGYLTAGSTTLGDRVMTGGGVRVGGHLEISSNVQLAGASVVRKDITEPGQYGGDPLQPMKDFLKTLLSLPELPKIKKEFRQKK